MKRKTIEPEEKEDDEVAKKKRLEVELFGEDDDAVDAAAAKAAAIEKRVLSIRASIERWLASNPEERASEFGRQRIVSAITSLAMMEKLSLDILQRTKIGIEVNKVKRASVRATQAESLLLSQMCTDLVSGWKKLIK